MGNESLFLVRNYTEIKQRNQYEKRKMSVVRGLTNQSIK
jgi:hypothetical protein